MDSCDVVIVGGGPAGSTCAWKLHQAGLDAVVIDRHTFPRDKICGGWITPAVVEELGLDPCCYARSRTFQPITGFRVGVMGQPEVEAHYGVAVSYGIRRREFDHYLLERSGARLCGGRPLTRLERANGHWIVNGEIRAPFLVGAGGHFCPVARHLGARIGREIIVAAREAEFEMDLPACAVRAEIPEIYFCQDMKGYGWCFRKGNVLNVGLGRLDQHRLSAHVGDFFGFLRSRKLGFDLPAKVPGHAYLLYATTSRDPVTDGVLLIGDAAGLAYSLSGEGIGPAVESGLLAAQAILSGRPESYRALLAARFAGCEKHWLTRLGRALPSWLAASLGRGLLHTEWFTRNIVLDRWFLHL